MRDETMPIHALESEILRLLTVARLNNFEALAFILAMAAMELDHIRAAERS